MRNAVKKRVKKQIMQMIMEDVKITRYPRGSFVVFSGKSIDGVQGLYSCSWYDKVGGDYPCKHIIWKPKEWQNITLEQAEKIKGMFADGWVVTLKYK